MRMIGLCKPTYKKTCSLDEYLPNPKGVGFAVEHILIIGTNEPSGIHGWKKRYMRIYKSY